MDESDDELLDFWELCDNLSGGDSGAYGSADADWSGFGPWQYLESPHPIHIKDTSSIDEVLLKSAKEEMTALAHNVKTALAGKPASLCNVVNVFLGSLIEPLALCANTGKDAVDHVSTDNIVEFIRCFAALTMYKCSPKMMWDKEIGASMFPAGVERDQRVFKCVVRGLNTGTRRESEPSSRWGEPFKEDPSIRRLERAIATTNSELAFIRDITRLSIDDDQLRLSSKKVEDVGLVRVNIPNKAFGPVRLHLFVV